MTLAQDLEFIVISMEHLQRDGGREKGREGERGREGGREREREKRRGERGSDITAMLYLVTASTQSNDHVW